MSKVMQNLVILKEQSQYAFYNSWKAGNMIFNRFCIDEDAAFELSGVYYLARSSSRDSMDDEIKGKGSFIRNTYVLYSEI